MRLEKKGVCLLSIVALPSELCYAFVIARSESTNRSGGTAEAGYWRTPFGYW
jgi:hypothetical protein